MSDITCCELCERERTTTFHHLIPKKVHKRSRVKKLHSKEAMTTDGAYLCHDCHKAVHKLYDHQTLALEYYSIELMRTSEELMKFVDWVRKQNKKAKI